MNRAIGFYAAWLNALAVAVFAASMLIDSYFLSCLSSVVIAFSFVAMTAVFAHFAPGERRVAGLCALAFGAMYALCNAGVYFIQLTTVRAGALSEEAISLLDYRAFGMMFNIDMLGYALMALGTLFAGLSFCADGRADRWLKGLLLAHGAFAVACLVFPILGLFQADMAGGDLLGVLVLEFWCAWFFPIGLLAARHFRQKRAVPGD